MSKTKYKVGGLFSGIGGIELGFEKAGYDIAWANEFDPKACITYRANFKEHFLIEEDIWTLIDNDYKHNGKELNGIDVLVGGFPCQAFSVAGYRKGFEDPRGNLFFAITEFISHFQPKAFVLENVKNLERHDGGKTFGRIYSELDNLGYSVIYKVMNTSDYTEIPQTRERIFIIGFKGESDFNKAELFKKDDTPCSDSFIFPEKTENTKSIKQMLSKVKVDKKYYYTANTYFWDEIKENMKSRDTVYQWRRKYIRENKSNLCPTLTANMGMGGHNVPLVIDSTGGYRKLTPKECFRFQGFNEIKLPKISDSSLYKQAGNSVTVPLIIRLAESLMISLDAKYEN